MPLLLLMLTGLYRRPVPEQDQMTQPDTQGFKGAQASNGLTVATNINDCTQRHWW
jgi:hypothetical protein